MWVEETQTFLADLHGFRVQLCPVGGGGDLLRVFFILLLFLLHGESVIQERGEKVPVEERMERAKERRTQIKRDTKRVREKERAGETEKKRERP